MRDSTHEILITVAAEHCVTVERLLSTSRKPCLVAARVDAAKRLRATFMTVTQIGKVLRRDHTTISFYLGGVTAKKPGEPQEPRWSKPHITWLTRTTRIKPRELVSYAGASFGDIWKVRGHGRR